MNVVPAGGVVHVRHRFIASVMLPLLLCVQIVLVDQIDRFVFKPLLYELLTQGDTNVLRCKAHMNGPNGTWL